MTKYCGKCKSYKDTSEYSANKRTSDKLFAYCKPCSNYLGKKWKAENKQKVINWKKEYDAKNRELINKQHRSYIKNRKKNEPAFKLRYILRNSLLKKLKSKKWIKNSKYSEYIGCSQEELKQYIEAQFEPWMTWENHGNYDKNIQTWQIDHIIPLASAKTDEELYKLCHYTNLKPLKAIDNLRKSDKM